MAGLGQDMSGHQLYPSGPLMAYAASIAVSPSSDLCNFERLEQRVEQPQEILISKSTLAAIFESRIETRMGVEPSIALTARNPARLGQADLRPRIKTGYGDIFDNDTIGRSRTAGAGLRERDWFYFKVSVIF